MLRFNLLLGYLIDNNNKDMITESTQAFILGNPQGVESLEKLP